MKLEHVATGRWCGLKPIEVVLMLLALGLTLCASHFGWWSIGIVEAWGFATGGVCVWLVLRQHMWNWPVGLANNVFFFVLFLQSRLYADMGLQIVYFGLGVYGWWNWKFGGENRSPLVITRTSFREWCLLGGAILLGTWGLREILLMVNGSAPLGDALTTALSLAAQYLLCQKRLENWFLWIAADAIYVPLYLSRNLALTAALYGVFLVMCVFGFREWTRSWKERSAA